MRHGSGRRQRHRSNPTRRSNPSKSRVFDSNGPDVRIRGTAFQVTEKYLALAKDAAAAGDKVREESYLQHAEHYQRVINSWEAEAPYSNDRSQQSESVRTDESFADESDLSLPTSILGPKADAAPKEAVGEDA